MDIRDEGPQDHEIIGQITTAAFAPMAYSSGTEAAIITTLRQTGALTLSLVAVEEGTVIGHVAFSPVTIGGADVGWYGLGPVSVRPDRQGRGIGSALIRAGLARLRQIGAGGCVLVGNPAYYRRFGFGPLPGLRFSSAPAENFMALRLTDADAPQGEVAFHPGFGVH
ncbi:MAG: GNAT family N-acetyltransferase [Pseudodonghicola sp.]